MMDETRLPGDRFVYETCNRCGRRSTVSFVVDHDVWQAVVGDTFFRVCTTCFDELADKADVAYVFREIHVTTWNQGFYDEWPHLDVPCAECAGRRTREWYYQRTVERAAS